MTAVALFRLVFAEYRRRCLLSREAAFATDPQDVIGVVRVPLEHKAEVLQTWPLEALLISGQSYLGIPVTFFNEPGRRLEFSGGISDSTAGP